GRRRGAQGRPAAGLRLARPSRRRRATGGGLRRHRLRPLPAGVPGCGRVRGAPDRQARHAPLSVAVGEPRGPCVPRRDFRPESLGSRRGVARAGGPALRAARRPLLRPRRLGV
ncbi:MAG: hypothetical protein AVDCRST_MAG05-1441, partial [uncultured Rubrobacteraceae bacterium]